MRLFILRFCAALCLLFLIVAPSNLAYAECPDSSSYEHWEDLLNFEPRPEDFSDEGNQYSNPDFEFQRLNGDYSDNINLDDFSVRIDRLPPRFGSPEAFFDHFRRYINSFFDNDIATMRGINRDTTAAWLEPGTAPVGSIHIFDMHGAGWGAIQEQGAVIVTRSSRTSWTFSTITIDIAIPGEHPVSGHREFGIRRAGGGKYEIYVRAVDRVTGGFPDSIVASESDVIAGGQDLWRSFQQNVADFINDNGGLAYINEPLLEYPPWDSAEMRDCVTPDPVDPDPIIQCDCVRNDGEVLYTRPLRRSLCRGSCTSTRTD